AVDWGALLGLMANAAKQSRDPFTEAVRAQERLFTTRPIFLGVEESMRHPDVPCGLRTDAERARHVRKRVREIQNSRGEWENMPEPVFRPLREIFVPQNGAPKPEFLPENRTQKAPNQNEQSNALAAEKSVPDLAPPALVP